MNPDVKRIRLIYDALPRKIKTAREILQRPLTLSEKILYSHLFDQAKGRAYQRETEYGEFAPDRIAMQDATAQMALLQFMVTGKGSSSVPASVHCDHLITAKEGAIQDLRNAILTNREVYDFLRAASSKYSIDFWQPGSGIIHQIVLENYAFPGGLMIGTDSHTPTAGGLGMLAIGVGGADAVDVMSGMGWELKFPKIIGIKLTGRLNGWVSAKDVILKLTGLLSAKGGTGFILEYFGEGAESLSATGKATICNMGAETGATSSLFGFDNSIAEYLSASSRKKISELAAETAENLMADPEVTDSPAEFFDKYIELDLTSLEPYINGPYTPDHAMPLSTVKDEVKKHNWPEIVSCGLIGSCTNSSYEDISRAASVITDALGKKIMPKAELKITPGSEKIRMIAEREGYLATFREAGAEIFANACGPCIGQWERSGAANNPVNTVIHSFNRNFSKRTDGNPNTHTFVASPEIVAAITLAGKLTFNPVTDTLVNTNGKSIKLAEPEGRSLPRSGFKRRAAGVVRPAGLKRKPVRVAIDPGSERLQMLPHFDEWEDSDFKGLHLLMKTKGKCTTDHISMAGKWLKYRGHLENISRNYMTGAVNSFNEKTGIVINQLTGIYEAVPSVAMTYKNTGSGSVVVGEENFGEGSSREHAALEPRFLNVRAILVKSFARIHETNLKKQGILALTFVDKNDYDRIREEDRIDVSGFENFAPGSRFEITFRHSDGTSEKSPAEHSYSEKQIEWFRAGSALNFIRKKQEK
jgi:aconitate hydratase